MSKVDIVFDVVALEELDFYFGSNFKEFGSTDFFKSHMNLIALGHVAEKDFWIEWNKEIEVFCLKLKSDYHLETDISKLKCIIFICTDLSEIVELYRNYKDDFKHKNEQIKQLDRLSDFINKIPKGFFNSMSSNRIPGLKSIQFNLVNGNPIKIDDVYSIRKLISNIKDSNFLYRGEIANKSILITRVLHSTAKLLHKYFVDNSNLKLKNDYQTSNEICRIIYDLFLFTNLLQRRECDVTTPENNIRIMIRRSNLV